MSIPLYKITTEIQTILSKLEDGDGELTDDLAASLDSLEGAFEDKVENVLKYQASQAAAAGAVGKEICRLSSLQESYTRRADSLKDYVFRSMKSLGRDKVQGKLFTVWIQKNGRPSIELEADVDIPEYYKRTKVEFDSQLAYQEWKAGTPMPPGVKVTQGSHLRIK